MDDPLLLERYRMLQQPMYPYSAHPGLLSHAGLNPFLQGAAGAARYPPELLGAHLPLVSPSAAAQPHRPPSTAQDRSKSEEDARKEREEREREREREQREREQREREQREKEERERLERERERREKEQRERERAERERIERERQLSLERERHMSLERLRQERERRTPPTNRHDDAFAGKHFPHSQLFQPQSTPLVVPHPPSSVRHKHEDERSSLRGPNVVDKETERQLMHQQFLREQDLLMRERERRIEMEKADRERSLHPHASPGSQPHIPSVTNKYHDGEQPANCPPNLYRPYQSLTNGFERNHFTDYERRLMNESILAHDRQIFQNAARIHSSQPPPKDLSEHTSHSADTKSALLKIPDHTSLRNSNHVTHPAQLPQYQSNNQSSHATKKSEYGNHLSYDHSSISQSVTQQSHDLRTTERYSVAPSIDPQPVLYSKLDLEERHIREARLDESYNSDISDAEDYVEEEVEKKRQRLLVITNGPPLKLNKSRPKLSFLRRYGLTTKASRKEIDFDRLKKHREIYKEPVVSPVLHAEVQPSKSVPLLMPKHIHPEELNREPDYRQKQGFLHQLGLAHVMPDKRRQMDQIRRACELDRIRRNGIHPYLQSRMDENRSPLDRRYRQHSSSPPNLKRKHPDSDPVTSTPQHSDPPRVTLTPVNEATLAGMRASSTPIESHSQHRHTADSRTLPLFSDSRGSDAKRAAVSKDFAHEFHESVLQTTRQQQESRAASLTSGNKSDVVRYSLQDDTSKSTDKLSANSFGNHRSKSELADPSSSKDQSGPNSSSGLRWPGIEMVMVSYHRYLEELKMERQVMNSQFNQLQRLNHELNTTAQTLSGRITGLQEGKQQKEEERGRCQSAIDGLKKCIKLLR